MKHNRKIWLAMASLLVLIALPGLVSAQGRGRGRGNQDWKCGKFVNCHDARDGRWDNRGARGTRIGRTFRNNDYYSRRNADYYYRNGRLWRANRGNTIFSSRNSRLDRDGDGDFDRYDRRLSQRQYRIQQWPVNERRNWRRIYSRRWR